MNTLLPINSDAKMHSQEVSKSSNTSKIQALFGVFSMTVDNGGTQGMKWGRVRSMYLPQSYVSHH